MPDDEHEHEELAEHDLGMLALWPSVEAIRAQAERLAAKRARPVAPHRVTLAERQLAEAYRRGNWRAS